MSAEAATGPAPSGDHAKLHELFPDACTAFDVLEDGNGVTTVAPDELFTVARKVRDMGYEIMSLLSAYDRGDHFGVLYAFVTLADSEEKFRELRLRVTMPKAVNEQAVEPKCPSLCDLWPAANWQEREMYDMYDIQFEGHPDLRRMFLPEGWEGFPMRKDDKTPEQFVALREGEDIVLSHQEEGSW